MRKVICFSVEATQQAKQKVKTLLNNIYLGLSHLDPTILYYEQANEVPDTYQNIAKKSQQIIGMPVYELSNGRIQVAISFRKSTNVHEPLTEFSDKFDSIAKSVDNWSI